MTTRTAPTIAHVCLALLLASIASAERLALVADFEQSLPKWFAFEEGGSEKGIHLSGEQAHGGKQSLKFASPTGLIRCQLPRAAYGYDGQIELWAWEDPKVPGKRAVGAGQRRDRSSSVVIQLGVADKEHVGYRFGGPEATRPGEIARDSGWHKWTLDFREGEGVRLYVDDRLLAEDPDRDRFDSMSLGVNWQQGKVWYVDDLMIDARRLVPPPEEEAWFQVRPPAVPAREPPPFAEGIYELLLRQIACEYGYLKQQLDAVPEGEEFVPPNPVSSGVRIRELGSRLLAFAAALKLGEYDAEQTGVPAAELTHASRLMARAVARTHLVGPDVTADGNPWGGEWQSALWAAQFGTGAWLLWEGLDEETKALMPRAVAYEADRFLNAPAPFQEFLDTKAEENAWNSEAIALAYVMLPNHPHRERWRTKALEYMITATAREADLERADEFDGRPLKDWLRGPNVHEDYTMENHGFVHPDYTLSFKLNFWNAAVYRLGGEPIPEALYFNAKEIVEAMRPFVLPDGCLFYPQGTDWSVHRLDCGWGASSLNAWFPDPFLAAAERKSYETVRLGLSLPRGDTLYALEHWGQNVWCLAEYFMAHRLFGPGAEPATDEQWRNSVTGVRVYKAGKFVLHRTKDALAAFSWFPARIMGQVLPLRDDNLVYPTPQSLVGYVGPLESFRAPLPGPWTGPPKGADRPELKDHTVAQRESGLSVTCRLHRMGGAVEQVCSFNTLPDGMVVYLEAVRALKPVENVALRTGMVSFLDNSRWPIEDPTRFTGDVHGSRRRAPWLRQKAPRHCLSAKGEVDVTTPEPQSGGRWVNVDDAFGLVRVGEGEVLVAPYARAGFQVILNALDIVSRVEVGTVLSRHGCVFAPGRTAAETASLAEQDLRLSTDQDGSVRLLAGDVRVTMFPEALRSEVE